MFLPARVWAAAAAGLAGLGAVAAAFAAPLQESALGRSLFAWLHLDQEQGIGTWFTSAVLLLGALACGHVGRRCRALGRSEARVWLALAIAVAAMSLDETVGLHERLGNVVARTLPVGGLGTFAWILPGAVFVGAGAILLRRFLRQQERGVQRGLIVAGTCYFGGALGCEAVGAWIHGRFGKESWPFEAEVVLEEGLEMLGAVLLLRAVLRAADQFAADAGPEPPPSDGASPAEPPVRSAAQRSRWPATAAGAS